VTADVEALRAKVALSCRILSSRLIMREVTGHVSARIPGTDTMLLRCRGPHDPGVAGTQPDDIRIVDFEGKGDEVEGFNLPGEFSIHAELYKARYDVAAVVHGHPHSSLVCGVAGIDIRPIFGAYDPVAMMLAHRDLGTYDRSWLISSEGRGQALVAAMAGRAACLLRGHGIVTVGASVEEATVRAIKLETLAQVSLEVARAGRHAPDIPDDEIDDLTASTVRQGAAMPVNQWTWDLYARSLDGGIPPA
jgi:ribulose-5-phosphate 4-epimerase/fuculose-1-phosphate aldolase